MPSAWTKGAQVATDPVPKSMTFERSLTVGVGLVRAASAAAFSTILDLPIRWLTVSVGMALGNLPGMDAGRWNLGVADHIFAYGATIGEHSVGWIDSWTAAIVFNNRCGIDGTAYLKQLVMAPPMFPAKIPISWASSLDSLSKKGLSGLLYADKLTGWRILFGRDILDQGIFESAVFAGVSSLAESLMRSWVSGQFRKQSRRKWMPSKINNLLSAETWDDISDAISTGGPESSIWAMVVARAIKGTRFDTKNRLLRFGMMFACNQMYTAVIFAVRHQVSLGTVPYIGKVLDFILYRAVPQPLFRTLVELLVAFFRTLPGSYMSTEWLDSIVGIALPMSNPVFLGVVRSMVKYQNNLDYYLDVVLVKVTELKNVLTNKASEMFAAAKAAAREAFDKGYALLQLCAPWVAVGFQFYVAYRILRDPSALREKHFHLAWFMAWGFPTIMSSWALSILGVSYVTPLLVGGGMVALGSGYDLYSSGRAQYILSKFNPQVSQPPFVVLPTFATKPALPALQPFVWSLQLGAWKEEDLTTGYDFLGNLDEYNSKVLEPVQKLLWTMLGHIMQVNEAVANQGEDIPAYRGNYCIVAEMLTSAFNVIDLLFGETGTPQGKGWTSVLEISGINSPLISLSFDEDKDLKKAHERARGKRNNIIGTTWDEEVRSKTNWTRLEKHYKSHAENPTARLELSCVLAVVCLCDIADDINAEFPGWFTAVSMKTDLLPFLQYDMWETSDIATTFSRGRLHIDLPSGKSPGTNLDKFFRTLKWTAKDSERGLTADAWKTAKEYLEAVRSPPAPVTGALIMYLKLPELSKTIHSRDDKLFGRVNAVYALLKRIFEVGPSNIDTVLKNFNDGKVKSDNNIFDAVDEYIPKIIASPPAKLWEPLTSTETIKTLWKDPLASDTKTLAAVAFAFTSAGKYKDLPTSSLLNQHDEAQDPFIRFYFETMHWEGKTGSALQKAWELYHNG
jgi:hypothetical protein